nr:helix-turn-helix domain-containing protein [Allomuricauda sp.]
MSTLIQILIFGSLILASFLSITNPGKVNRKANLWFGITLLLWSTFWFEEIVMVAGWKPLNPWLVSLLMFLQLFTPLVLYICIIFFTNPSYRLKKNALFFLVMPALYGVMLILQQGLSYDLEPILLGFLLAHSLFYISISFVKIRRHQKNTQDFSSNAEEIDLKWLEYIIIAILIITIAASVLSLLFYDSPLSPYLGLAMLATVYFIAYHLIKQKEIFPLNEKHREDLLSINEEELEVIHKRKIISEEKLVELKSKLNKHMNEEQPHLDNEINLASLSEQLGLTPHQLSYVINNGFDENFFQFINRYRVEKAKDLLSSSISDKYSILGIAFESGFSSKTSFNTTFKKITGQTPSEFKKNGSSL